MDNRFDRQVLLSRPRLVQALQRAAAGRVTLVVAPAGYGKTSLLSEFARTAGVPVVWCRLGPEDAAPHAFTRKVAETWQRQMAPAGAGQGDVSLSKARLHQVLRSALAEPAIHPSSAYAILVLEDYHHVAGTLVNEVLGQVLAELPSGVHVVVSSRVWPEIPHLPKMLASQQAAVLDAGQLAFTEGEVADYLRLMAGRSPQPDDVARLADVTRGWPACISLLASQQALEEVVRHGRAGLYAYLAEEVLRSLPVETARFMLDTSVLPRLTPGTCDDLLGRSDSAEHLEELRGRRLLHIPPDPGDACEYHPVLREFLLARLRAEAVERYRELHLRAAEVLWRDGAMPEAVSLLASVGAWRELADCLEGVGPDLLRQGRWGAITDWIDRLPPEMLRARETLLILRSRLAYLQGDAATALRLLASREDVSQTGRGLITKAAALTLVGQPQEAARTARQGLALAKQTGEADLVAEARCYLGVVEAIKGSYAAAERSLRAALRHFLSTGDTYHQAVCYGHLAGICHFQERTAEEAAFLESAERLWRELGNREQLLRTLNNLGVSHHRRGRTAAAMAALTECLDLASRIGLRVEEAYALVSLADVTRDRARLAEADGLYRRGLDLARELGEHTLYAYALAGQAEVRRAAGDLDEAEALARQAVVEAAECQDARAEGQALTVLGAVHRDKRRYAEAITVLERACDLLERAGGVADGARARFLEAAARYAVGQRSRALERLDQAAAIVARTGQESLVLPLVARDRSLVQYAAARRGAPYAQWLARTGGSAEQMGTRPSAGTHPEAVRVTALGGFTVVADGTPVSEFAWETAKAREMLLYFVTSGSPVLRDEIVEALWPEIPLEKCSSQFHATLHRVRQALGRDAVIREGQRYGLNPAMKVESDVALFLRAAEACRSGEPSAEALRAAAGHYGGRFAPELYSDWADDLRRRLEETYVWVLGRLLAQLESSGDEAEVAATCERILELDPYHEAAWARLIRSCRDQGLVGQALRHYRRCVDVFTGELGTEVPAAVASLLA